MSDCGLPETTNMGGGIRFVGRCGRPATDEFNGEKMCRFHADTARYQHREFERQMAMATRHSRQIGYGIPGAPGSGVYCSCGTFVAEGESHPFGVPHSQESATSAALLRRTETPE